jgi:hypothetical protein
MMIYGMTVPSDWREPDWYNAGKCHDWKNYRNTDIVQDWQLMPDDHKQLISAILQEQADTEEWD